MRKPMLQSALRYQLRATAPRQPRMYWRSFWIGASLTLPLCSLLYLVSQLFGSPFLPGVFFTWFIHWLPGLVRSLGFLLAVGTALTLDLMIDNVLFFIGTLGLYLLFGVSGGLVTLLYMLLNRARLWQNRWLVSAGCGTLWGVGLTILTLSQNPMLQPVAFNTVAGYVGAILLFALWGTISGRASVKWFSPAQPPIPTRTSSRRRFLLQVSATMLTVTLCSGAVGLQLARLRRRGGNPMQAAAFTNPAAFPSTLKARIYPMTNANGESSVAPVSMPEFDRSRYRPDAHPIGVCFSSGGPLSAAASVGQMRGLHALGLLDQIGAISSVSGGAWFGTVFSYAPTTISDTTLLGAVIEPEAITLDNLAMLDPQYGAAAFARFSTEQVGTIKTGMMVEIGRYATPPFNRLYSRTLNEFLLKPFALDDPHKLFTLDQTAVAEITARNPQLQPADFYTMRPDRPYLIAGAVQAHPVGADQRLRMVEMTPLYTGLPQAFPGEGADGLDIGGGYVESFAFDSPAPLARETDDCVHVATPNPPFLLSDLIGSSGAAPGALLNSFGQPEWFPKFNYWSPTQRQTNTLVEQTAAYSFIDGALLEGSGIIPLLRRHYPIILAFINVDSPLGAETGFTVNGLNQAITKLFGLQPTGPYQIAQEAHVFPQHQLQALQAGLERAKAEQRAPWFMDSYEVIQPNVFDIPPYPGDGERPGKVTVIWFYNDLNQAWWEKLPPSVQALFQVDDPTNRLSNFPNYNIFAQNSDQAGLPQLLNLTPQQINLLAHMWCYTVMHDAGETLQAVAATEP